MRIDPYVTIYLRNIYCSPDAIFSLSLISSIVHSPFALVKVVASLWTHSKESLGDITKKTRKMEMSVHDLNIQVSIIKRPNWSWKRYN